MKTLNINGFALVSRMAADAATTGDIPASYETDEEFNKALHRFEGANKNAQAAALVCSTMGLEHFAKHGDVSYIQRFDDELSKPENKNWNRLAAFRRWLAAHAPLTMRDGKYKKDVSETARKDVDLTGAMSKPFWEFAPSREAFSFDVNDIIGGLQRVIKRMHGDKATAASPEATEVLAKVETFVKSITPAEKAKAA